MFPLTGCFAPIFQSSAMHPVARQPVQTMKALPHVGCARRQIDPRCRSEGPHLTLQSCDQPVESPYFEVLAYLDAMAALEHHGQVTTNSLVRTLSRRYLDLQ